MTIFISNIFLLISEMPEDLVELNLDDKRLTFDPLWLRDHCRCDQCYNHTTFQRKLKITDISDSIAVKSYQFENDCVNVTCEFFLLEVARLKFTEQIFL